MWKRLKINSSYIFKTAGKWTMAIYAVLGLLATFVSLEGVLDAFCIVSLTDKIIASVIILLITYILCSFIVSLVILNKGIVKVLDAQNGHYVYVLYGNLFDEKLLPSNVSRRSICFAVNRCFDTIVDNVVISASTVHGSTFKKLYDNGIFTPETLNSAIQSSISPEAKYKVLSKNQKPSGNLKRYEVGTGADITISESLHYFLIGLGKMDENLKNKAEVSEYCLAVQKMIEFFDTCSQGFPVLMPIVGAGLSRLGQNPKELLKYIIQSFAMNKSHINSDIYIVLREQDRERISIVEYKQ